MVADITHRPRKRKVVDMIEGVPEGSVGDGRVGGRIDAPAQATEMRCVRQVEVADERGDRRDHQ